MKKLLMSTALMTVLFSGAALSAAHEKGGIKISGSLETTINTLSKKTSGTSDNSGPTNIGHEAVVKISTSKTLSNGLTMSAGFDLDSSVNATDTGKSDGFDNQFVTLSSGGTSFSIGHDVSGVADNVSQEDFTPHVAQDFHSVSTGGSIAGVDTAHGRNGIYLKHTTDMLTFEGVYSPSAATNTTAASSNTEASGSGYDLAVKGNLGVPGLTIGYGVSELQAITATGAVAQEGKGYGVKYAASGFTVGYGVTDNTAAGGLKEENTTYGISYQVNKGLSVSAAYGEVETAGEALEEEYKTLQVGYDFGGMGITAGYYEVENIGGSSGVDNEVFEIRTVTKF